jgi:secondary thiamine-phosphate synthase enzyme
MAPCGNQDVSPSRRAASCWISVQRGSAVRLTGSPGATDHSGMHQSQHTVTVATPGRGLVDITDPIARWAAGCGITMGLLTLFIRHTSASLLIQENADPDVLRDLEVFFDRLVPDDLSLYRHVAEGTDDMPAHIRSALTQTQLSIPFTSGNLALGTWQAIYLFEHRTRPHRREVLLHLIGA